MKKEDYEALRAQYEQEIFLCRRKLIGAQNTEDKMFWIGALEFWLEVVAELDIKALIGAYIKKRPTDIYRQMQLELDKGVAP